MKTDLQLRHQQLHGALDELLACYMGQRSHSTVLDTPLGDFLAWSHQQTVAPTCDPSHGLKLDAAEVVEWAVSGTAQEDPELLGWLLTAAGKSIRPPAGGFVRAIADAALKADHDNYRLLRPALLAMKAKYPRHAKEGE